MKKIIFIVILSLCVASVSAQNPFLVKAEVIQSFDISPDAKSACVLWMDLKGNISIRIKDLSTGAVKSVNPAGRLMGGVSFLGNDKVLFAMDSSMMVCNVSDGKVDRLFSLKNTSTVFFVNSIGVSLSGRTIYFSGSYASEMYLYVAQENRVIVKTFRLPNDGIVLDINPDGSNGVLFSTIFNEQGKYNHQLMFADHGNCKPWGYVPRLEKIVSAPYIAQGTGRVSEYIVVGKEGIFVVDTTKNNAVCIAKQDTPPNVVERICYSSADKGVVYYVTMRQRGVVQRVTLDGTKLPNITF